MPSRVPASVQSGAPATKLTPLTVTFDSPIDINYELEKSPAGAQMVL